MIDISPLVIRCREETKLQLCCNQGEFAPEANYRLTLLACECYGNDTTITRPEVIGGFAVSHSTNRPRHLDVERRDAHTLTCTLCLAQEQEYIIQVCQEHDGILTHLQSVSIYAIQPDLAGLLPYKGDLHLHSIFSDGLNHPAEIAVQARNIGFDFIALTDHGKQFPSVELAQRFQALVPLGLTLLTGEEVHLPGHQAHILNIGGTESVNKYFLSDRKRFLDEIEALEKKTDTPIGLDPTYYTMALWAFAKIKEYDGLSVFCHPYWRRPTGYDLSSNFTEAMLEQPRFDALELISGYAKKESYCNNLQVMRYFAQPSDRRTSVVGVSDSHSIYPHQVPAGEHMFGCFYTIVFAQSNRREDILSAIKAGRSLAVEQLEGEQLRIYGDFRLTKYALFLCRNFFDAHDALAAEESLIMQRFLRGESVDAAAAAVHRALTTLYQKIDTL